MADMCEDESIKLQYCKEAINYFGKTIDIDSDNIRAYFNLANILITQADLSTENETKINIYKKSECNFNKVIELNIEYKNAYFYIALIYAELHKIATNKNEKYLYIKKIHEQLSNYNNLGKNVSAKNIMKLKNVTRNKKIM